MFYVRFPTQPSRYYEDTGRIYKTKATYNEFRDLCKKLGISSQVQIDHKDENGCPSQVSFVKYKRFSEEVKREIKESLGLSFVYANVPHLPNRRRITQRQRKYRIHAGLPIPRTA